MGAVSLRPAVRRGAGPPISFTTAAKKCWRRSPTLSASKVTLDRNTAIVYLKGYTAILVLGRRHRLAVTAALPHASFTALKRRAQIATKAWKGLRSPLCGAAARKVPARFNLPAQRS